MLIEVRSVGAGHATTRTRYGGEVERIWVRPVVLHCTDIESGSALNSAASLMPDADAPRQSGGGWDVSLVVQVRDEWEDEEATALRTAHVLDARYEQERTRHADDDARRGSGGSLLQRMWRRL